MKLNPATNKDQQKAIDKILCKDHNFSEKTLNEFMLNFNCCGVFPTNDCSECSEFKNGLKKFRELRDKQLK